MLGVSKSHSKKITLTLLKKSFRPPEVEKIWQYKTNDNSSHTLNWVRTELRGGHFFPNYQGAGGIEGLQSPLCHVTDCNFFPTQTLTQCYANLKEKRNLRHDVVQLPSQSENEY